MYMDFTCGNVVQLSNINELCFDKVENEPLLSSLMDLHYYAHLLALEMTAVEYKCSPVEVTSSTHLHAQ